MLYVKTSRDTAFTIVSARIGEYQRRININFDHFRWQLSTIKLSVNTSDLFQIRINNVVIEKGILLLNTVFPST